MNLKIHTLFVIIFSLLSNVKINAQQSLPINCNCILPPIIERKCETLQKNLKTKIFKNSKWKRLVESIRMAIVQGINNVKYAGLNDNNICD